MNKVVSFGGNKCPIPEYPDVLHDDFWVHHMKGREWTKKTRIPHPMCSFGYSICPNERYIYLSHVKYGVYRLCLNSWKWYKSTKAEAPTKEYHGIHVCSNEKYIPRNYDNRVNDMYLGWGYVRYVYKYGGYKRQIPMLDAFTMNIVIDYMLEGKEEYLHVIDCSPRANGAHFRYSITKLFDDAEPIKVKPPIQPQARRPNRQNSAEY